MKWLFFIGKSIALIALLSFLYTCSTSDEEPEALGVITGFIKNENGVGLDEVTVVLKSTTESKTTDSYGKYEFKNVKRGGHDIYASKTGYISDSIHVNIKSNLQEAETMILKKSAGDITGIIVPQVEGTYVVLF